MVVEALDRLANIADQSEYAEFLFLWCRWGKLHLPEIFNVVKKGNAVPVNAGVFADLANHADFGFFVALGPAQNHFLFGAKFVPGEQAGAVKAEESRLRFFGKDSTFQIGADQNDGNLFGDASASAHNLLWQGKGHKRNSPLLDFGRRPGPWFLVVSS